MSFPPLYPHDFDNLLGSLRGNSKLFANLFSGGGVVRGRFTLSPITLDISGDSAGPLGALVCQIVALLGTVANVVGLLNNLLGALTGLVGGVAGGL